MERIETLDPAGEGEPGRMQSGPRWASGTRKLTLPSRLLPISARLIEGEDAAHGLPSVDLETISGSLRGMTPN